MPLTTAPVALSKGAHHAAATLLKHPTIGSLRIHCVRRVPNDGAVVLLSQNLSADFFEACVKHPCFGHARGFYAGNSLLVSGANKVVFVFCFYDMAYEQRDWGVRRFAFSRWA